jgi:hypothetical protein
MSSPPLESGVTLHHKCGTHFLITDAARLKALGISAGAVLFFADDGGVFAGELGRRRFLELSVLGV